MDLDSLVRNSKNNTSRSRSAASPKKNENRRAAHNSAGRKPGFKVQTPSMGVMDGIYSDDDSPTRNTHHTPNQESDNSHFSRGNEDVTGTKSNKPNREKQVQYEKEQAQDKVKRKRQHQKNKLAESQRKKDNNTECINVDDDDDDDDDDEIDNCSTQGCFDGIPTDKVLDPKQQEHVKKLKDKFGEDDDSYTKAVERSKKHRGSKHGESSLAVRSSPTNNHSKSQKQRRRGGEQQRDYSSYGRAQLERGGGRVLPSHSADPLDIAVSQQKIDRGSSSKDMVAPPKLKKNGKGRKKQQVSTSTQQKPWGAGDMTSNRVKQREEQAAAALKRKTQIDGSGNNSSGEKRKRSSFGQQNQNNAIDVDDDDMMGILAAASNQRYEDKPKKVVELPPLGIGRRPDGRVGKAAEKKQKKKSQVDMGTRFKGKKHSDDAIESDGDGFMDKPIPKKKNMKNKLKSQGAQFNSPKDDQSKNKHSEQKTNYDWLSPMTERGKKKKTGGRRKKSNQQTLDLDYTTKRETRSSSSGRRSKKNEVITIDSSSDEGDDSSASESAAEQQRSKRAFGDVASIDAVRIGVGKRVFRSKCKLSFQFGTNNPYIEFSYENKKGKMTDHTVFVKGEELTEVKYHIPDENDTGEDGADSDSMTMIAFRINPSESNGFNKYSSAYSQESNDDPEKFHKQFISVEVRDTDDFRAMLVKMQDHPDLGMWCSKDSEIEFYDLERYAKALTDDHQKERKERMSTRVTRSGGRKKKKDSENKLLVVYPFGVDEAVLSEAASGLKELGGDTLGVENVSAVDNTNQPDDVQMQNSSDMEDVKVKSSRMHYVTIRDEDIERLCPGQFLNDTLVDFFMRWISRGESNNPDSNVHFFTSHFMTTLKDEGPEAVSSWTAKKNINIFKKKFVFIPVNADLHWSLCVVVNAGLIANWYNENQNVLDTEEHSCILFLDSLKMHSKNMYAKHIRKWLNFEWKRLGKGKVGGNIQPFAPKSMPSLSPKIPYQANGCDCGVFVCRYAYNLFLMRHLKFTWEDIAQTPPFKTLITKGSAFRFGMSDVARMRDEMERLIKNLSKIYLAMKEQEKADKKKSKRPVKTEEDEKKSSLPEESTSAEENNASTAADLEKKKDSSSDESMAEGGGDSDEHMADANEKDTSRDSMDTDEEGGGVSQPLLSSEDESPAAAKGEHEDLQESTSEEKENVVQEGSSQKSAEEDETMPDAPSTSDGEVDASTSPLLLASEVKSPTV